MEELQDYNENTEESKFDLKAEIFKYLTYWRWMILGIIVGCLLAYLYNRYTIPEYHSESSMMIVKDQDNNVMSALPSGGTSIFSLENSTLENQIVKLKSKRLIENVVDELDHNISYFIEGNVITVEAYKNSPIIINFISPDSIVNGLALDLFISFKNGQKFSLTDEESNYSKLHKLGEIVDFEGLKFKIEKRYNEGSPRNGFEGTVHIKLLPIDVTVDRYLDKLQIAPKGKAEDILALGVTQESSEKSRDFLNKLMERFNEDGVSNKREVAKNTTEFIQERLEIITEELDSVEGGMADFKRENRVMDVVSGAQEFKSRYAEAEQRIFDLETQLILLKSVKELIFSQNNFELLPADLGIQEGGISTLIGQYNQLVLERNALLGSATTQNPAVETLSTRLTSLGQNLNNNIDSAIKSVNVQIQELNQREQAAQGQFSSFPGLEKGIRGIERQQQIKEQLYLFLLQRREEAAISYASTSAVSRVIDPAFTLQDPVDPKPWLILLGGFIIGLLIPILVIFIKNLLDNKVHHKGDLQPLIKNVPFIGEIPKIEQGQTDVIHLNDRSPLAESFRILRTNLAYLIQNKNKEIADVIFVTSTVKGEGKTFISFNLSRTLASSNKKVLLIGADIRNPKLHRYTEKLHGAKDKGLSDFLYDYEVNIADIITNTNEDGIQVDVILSGPIPPNPAELLMNDRMEGLIENAKKNYDYVIVDTAPAMIVTDTLLISQLADYSLYVIRADYTEKHLLQFPADLKKQGKLKGLAIILNDIDYSKFSYGAQYGYSYGYGYGYGVDKESRWRRIKKRMFS